MKIRLDLRMKINDFRFLKYNIFNHHLLINRRIFKGADQVIPEFTNRGDLHFFIR
jgi:hypothetical protein